MPVNTSLLYGEMVGSALFHAAAAAIAPFILNLLPSDALRTRVIGLVIICVVFSFVIQSILMIGLQASACAGVKNYKRIFIAGFVGALLTGGMVAIPLFLEPMRLIVSQIFGPHVSLLTPEAQRLNDIATTAGMRILEATRASEMPDVPVKPAMPSAPSDAPVKPAMPSAPPDVPDKRPAPVATTVVASDPTLEDTGDPQAGGALSFEEYEEQTFKEMKYGAAYWATFAGAYGVGIGSMIASKCS